MTATELGEGRVNATYSLRTDEGLVLRIQVELWITFELLTLLLWSRSAVKPPDIHGLSIVAACIVPVSVTWIARSNEMSS